MSFGTPFCIALRKSKRAKFNKKTAFLKVKRVLRAEKALDFRLFSGC
nr:MAG TPA: hypothetical protein [Caudoviricetes sp.]